MVVGCIAKLQLGARVQPVAHRRRLRTRSSASSPGTKFTRGAGPCLFAPLHGHIQPGCL
jgi:hypothetical protein